MIAPSLVVVSLISCCPARRHAVFPLGHCAKGARGQRGEGGGRGACYQNKMLTLSIFSAMDFLWKVKSIKGGF